MADFNATLNFGATDKRGTDEIVRALEEMEKQNAKVVRALQTSLGRKIVNAGQIIEARAKEILTEKGHIVTGALRRSINTQPKIERAKISALVGSPMEYAPDVEALPDGGYLNEAAEQRFQLVTEFLAEEAIDPALQKWGEA